MKAAVCYCSRHHGNTRKVLEAMADEGGLDLIDVTTRQAVRLDGYDCIGFASGIYGFAFHPAVAAFASQYLPQGKPVFFVYNSGGPRGAGRPARAENPPTPRGPGRGEFGCRGYDTFGPFRLVGGIAKGRPDARDLENARAFYRGLRELCERGAHT